MNCGREHRAADRDLRAEFATDAGPATVIGGSQKTSAKAAAVINGETGRALDFDDPNLAGGFYATAVVLPTALALAEEIGASGAELVCAYVAGVEVCARLRIVVGEAHHRRGWRITSTVGVSGAVAAAGQSG